MSNKYSLNSSKNLNLSKPVPFVGKGFQPKTKLHEGITRFVEWYKSYYL